MFDAAAECLNTDSWWRADGARTQGNLLLRAALLAVCLLLGHADRAAAQATSQVERAPTAMSAGTKARLFAAGIGMGGVSFAIAGGLGYAASAGCNDAHDPTACGLLRRIGVGGAAGLVLVPIATAGVVSLTGRANGHRDRFGRTYLGALGGSLLGAGVAVLGHTLLAQGGLRTKASVSLSVAFGLATLSGTTTLAFWASDRRLARLSPAVSPQRGGATVGLGGCF